MATFKIGGVDRVIRPLNFEWMDRAWPALDLLMNEPPPPSADGLDLDDPVQHAEFMRASQAYHSAQFGKSIDAILTVVAEGLDQERELLMIEAEERGETITPPLPKAPDKARLRKLLRPDELPNVHAPIFDLLRESGMQLAGEQTPAGGLGGTTAAPSTETSTG